MDLRAVKTAEKSSFEPLYIHPDYEFNELRIDLVRQTEEHCDGDGNTTTEDVPYHAIGVDLGNSLFCDLHGNLSLRLDRLLDLPDDFHLRVQRSGSRYATIYSQVDDTLFVTRSWQSGPRYKRHRFTSRDSIALRCRDRHEYSIVHKTLGLAWGKGSRWHSLRQVADGEFYNSKARETYHVAQSNDIHVAGFVLSLSPDANTILVAEKLRRSTRPLFWLSKDDEGWYIYDKHFYGQRIERRNAGIRLHKSTMSFVDYSIPVLGPPDLLR